MDIEKFTDELIFFGRQERMQDLAIHPYEEHMRVLFRKNTSIHLYKELSFEDAHQVISRFKYLGKMDIGEKRKVQLGAITYRTKEFIQRLRLSTVGDYRLQESLVARFLYPLSDDTQHFFLPEQLLIVTQQTRPTGLYLFSGPTGSGKTTLMYHLAKKEDGQVITIEDPVEIEEPQFLQLQTNEKIQQTYDQLIQLSLRHRPDLLIIGEIRDKKTAAAAIRAALTGHKVFATIHARGVAETLDRIRDLVGENQELEHCLAGVIYQRLLSATDGRTGALLAYEFKDKAVMSDWRENLTKLAREGRIDETTLQIER
ncbi:competence type IV pilus ATPase ComGA [Enterococcus mediterraneensis]|uniref:competence type IV pilus ATPase ComGA n=1 Tax=Enterococcus mediterraneensis TaxID=2364791 RepID=UPI000F06183C|nr:competence type IV pilus ATPase ComGA [Enterococcus mediterraneensis]